MLTAATVSNYIISLLAQGRELETIKLHKLLYFCQGWCFAFYKKPLFNEDFEAWKFGPAIKEIYLEHAGMVGIPATFKFHDKEKINNNPIINTVINEEDKQLINAVLRDYGSLNSFMLVDLTHLAGTPWEQVYQEDMETQLISKQKIQEYFLKEMKRVKTTGELFPA